MKAFSKTGKVSTFLLLISFRAVSVKYLDFKDVLPFQVKVANFVDAKDAILLILEETKDKRSKANLKKRARASTIPKGRDFWILMMKNY
jgi:hypothetical protein